MSYEKSNAGQSGGVSIRGRNVNISAPVAGRDVSIGTNISPVQIEQVFHPVAESIRAHPLIRFVGDVGNKRVSNRV